MTGDIISTLIGTVIVGVIYYFILRKYKKLSVEESRNQSMLFAVLWGVIYFVLRLIFKW